MTFDPFSQVRQEQTVPEVIEKTVYVAQKPNMLFGVVEDKIFVGVLIGIIIANFMAEMS